MNVTNSIPRIRISLNPLVPRYGYSHSEIDHLCLSNGANELSSNIHVVHNVNVFLESVYSMLLDCTSVRKDIPIMKLTSAVTTVTVTAVGANVDLSHTSD